MRGTQFAQLSAFVAVAEHRSFTKAATYLGISTPSLSQAIRRLEEQFGVRLLNRTTRSVALTEAGEQLLGHLNPVLEGVENAIDSVNAFRDTPSGTLRLTVHPVAAATLLAPLVRRFTAEYPEISLDISVDIEQKDIVSDRFDAGIQGVDEIAQDMIALQVGGELPLSAVASPDYIARTSMPSDPDDLRNHNCVGYRWSTGIGHRWKFERSNEEFEIPVHGSLSVNDPHFALRAGLDGLGVVLLPTAWVSPLVAEGKLVRLLPDWSTKLTDFFLYYSSRRHVPLKLRVFADFLKREAKRAVETQPSLAVSETPRAAPRRVRAFADSGVLAASQI
jgi:DNA-binding transcriptional LysR family regulator